MKMRTIDADALIKALNELSVLHHYSGWVKATFLLTIDNMPTIQPDTPRVMKMAEEVFALRFDDVVYVEMYPTQAIVSAIVVDSIPWIKGELGCLQIRCLQEPLANMDFAWYGKTWRCWTARPTDEQRKAVKWNDPGEEDEEGRERGER